MSIEQFESWSLALGTGGLMLYMLFIIYRLGKESGASKFGYAMLFLALGLGMFGFVTKYVLVEILKI